jgi:hypothetical protein
MQISVKTYSSISACFVYIFQEPSGHVQHDPKREGNYIYNHLNELIEKRDDVYSQQRFIEQNSCDDVYNHLHEKKTPSCQGIYDVTEQITSCMVHRSNDVAESAGL